MQAEEWYYAKEGKAVGPKAKQEIESLLKAGTLTPDSMLFRVGETEWKRAKDCAEFATLKKEAPGRTQDDLENSKTVKEPVDPSKPLDLSGHAKWVLLMRSYEDTVPGQARFHQSGPFTKEQLLQKIEAGEVKWTDNVWTHGFKAWTRISSIKELNPDAEHAHVADKKEMESIKDAPPPTTNLVPVAAAVAQPEPVTLVTQSGIFRAKLKVDTSPKIEVESSKTAAVQVKPVQEPKPVAPVTPAAAPMRTQEIIIEEVTDDIPTTWFTPGRIMLYGGTFVILALILSVGLLFSSPEHAVVQDETASSARAIAEAPKPVEPPQAVETPPPPPAEPVKRFVRIRPLKLDSNRPQVAFETNIEPGQSIEVDIKSINGQILEVVRLSRSSSVSRNAGEVPTFDLSKWKLPKGSYIIEAKIDGSSTSTQIFIGQKNRQFQTALDKHNRKIAAQKLAEKKELQLSIKKLDRLGTLFVKNFAGAKKNKREWGGYYKDWLRDAQKATQGLVANYRPNHSERYVYPVAIEEVREASQGLIKSAKALNESLTSKRSPASTNDIKSIQQKLKQIRF